MSDFGPAGDTSSIWECPDLSLAPVFGELGVKKWVMLNSVQNTMQYFVGRFNGGDFISENPPDNIYRPDYGPDYYAAISYNNLSPRLRPVTIGWANNWNYGKDIPTSPWRSVITPIRAAGIRTSCASKSV